MPNAKPVVKRVGRPKGSAKTGGRKKGTPNKATVEAKSLCRRLVQDEEYRRGFEQRLRSGELPPALEAMVWHYAWGKPKEQVSLEHQGGVTLVWGKR